MTGEPIPIGRSAAEMAEIAARRAGDHAQILDAGLDEGDEGDIGDVDAVRAATEVERRERRWSKVCPQRFARWSLDDDFYTSRPIIRDQLLDWSTPREYRNLVIIGPTGTGKTGAALAACRPAADRSLEVRFLPSVEMLDLLRPGGPENAVDDLLDVDRLVIDDLGAEKPTDWTAERLYLVINRRWMEERPTVVTANVDVPTDQLVDEFRTRVGDRLASRLLGDGAVVVRMGGEDRRFAR